MKTSKALFAVHLLAFAAIPAQGLAPVGSCKEIQSWVAGLDRLPADYASFTALPSGHQKAVYHQLADSERAALWQHQWREALLDGNLTEDQQALVIETSRLMTEDLFAAMRAKEGARYEAANTQVVALKAKLAAAFPRAAYVGLFARLGEAKPAAGPLVCNCSLWIQECPCEVANCLPIFQGCGDFGMEACDGYCWR